MSKTQDAGRRFEESSMKRVTASVLATLPVGILIGFMLGIWVGSANMDFGSTGVVPRSPSSPSSSSGVKPRPAEDASALDRVGAKIVADVISDMKDQSSLVDFKKIGDLVSWEDGAEKVARLVIDEMSDDELVSTLVSLTTLTEERLDEVSDLRGYTNRLTEIAMSGLLTDPIEPKAGLGAVEFSTTADTDTGPHDPQSRFSSEEQKIYAVFTTETYRESRVFVHWYRMTNPKLLLFEQYRINHRDLFSYVWLEEKNGWEVGEYRVEVYSDTEDLKPIAFGSFNIVKGE
jgi:hypothetical protein